MATPNDPNNTNPSQVLDDLGNSAGVAGKIMSEAGQVFNQQLDSIKSSVSSVTAAFGALGDRIKENSQSLAVSGDTRSIEGLQDPLDKLTLSFGKLNAIMDQTKTFKFDFKIDSSPITDMTTSLDDLMETFNLSKTSVADVAKAMGLMNFVKNADEAEKLENAFVAMSSAGGELNKVFEGQGGQLKDLQALTSAYTTSVANSADITKSSVKQTMEMANALKTIPDFMDQLVRSDAAGSESTTALTTAMTLMSGTGKDQATIMHALEESYDNLSESQGKINDGAQKGAEYLSTVSSVSTGLNLKFKDVQDVMDQVADRFKDVGNETDGAARVLGRYTDALRETGLTSKESLNITRDVIKSMGDMTTGTKAFLSLSSGGPGGLQGAFQIEQLLRQGKVDQVTQMAERALKQQFGGKIYTQAEAAQSPEAASQFMRQRQLLQSGVFGIGKGMGDEQSTRLLEALGKGDTLTATKEIKTGQDALTAVTKQGTQVQDRTNNYLKDANRFHERTAIFTQITAGAAIRSAMGVTAPGAAAENERRRVAGKNTSIEQRNDRVALERGGAGNSQTEAIKQLLLLGRGGVDLGMTAAKGLAGGVGNAVKGTVGAAGDIVDAAQKIMSEVKQEKPYAGPKIQPADAPVGPKAAPMQHDAERRQAIYASTTAGRAPTHQMPAHVTAPKTEAEAATMVKDKMMKEQQQARTIRLEITHDKDFTVREAKKSSVHAHNAQSTVINLDDDLGH